MEGGVPVSVWSVGLGSRGTSLKVAGGNAQDRDGASGSSLLIISSYSVKWIRVLLSGGRGFDMEGEAKKCGQDDAWAPTVT